MKEIVLWSSNYHKKIQKNNKILELQDVKTAVERKYYNKTIFRQVLIKWNRIILKLNTLQLK